MSHRPSHRKPTFFWQGVLIVFPVVVLALIGLVSLRQDELLARHEAEVRAQTIADDLAQKVWDEIVSAPESDLSRHPFFQIDQHGGLIYPPPYTPVPVPRPLNSAELTAEHARLWRACELSVSEGADVSAAVEACEEFLELKPPDNFAAAAQFTMGTLFAQHGQPAAAAQRFDLLLEKYPTAVGESGIPLQPLAQLKLLELAPWLTNRKKFKNLPSLDLFLSNTVFHPTPLTPHLLSLPATMPGAGVASNTAQNRLLSLPGSQPKYDDGPYRPPDDARRRAVVREVQFREGRVAYGPIPAAKKVETPDEVRRRWQETWQETWQNHELARQLYETARSHFQTNNAPTLALLRIAAGNDASQTATNRPLLAAAAGESSVSVPRLFWFSIVESQSSGSRPSVSSQHWLAMSTDLQNAGLGVVCRDENEVGPALTQVVQSWPQFPEYFGITLELAGRSILSTNSLSVLVPGSRGKAAGSGWVATPYVVPPEVLASATKSETGTTFLRLNVHLTSPQMLFARQRERTRWFVLLISVSAAGALFGFVSARGAFQRQRQLAEMKTNFVSSVSHELRAPIASVRLMAEGLERGKVQGEQKQQEYFRFIVQECRRLSSLVENVLDFSRIEQGRKQYEFEPTDLVALIQGAAKLMEPQGAERQISITAIVPDEAVVADVDGKAIQQALVNLIDNAIKHSPNGSIVTVGLECVPQSRVGVSPAPNSSDIDAKLSRALPAGWAGGTPALLYLWVEDHGEGIPPEEH